MATLKAEIRQKRLKSKQLRRLGIVPGVLYGSGDNHSLSIQFSLRDVQQLLSSNTIGSKVELMIGEEKQLALLKEISYVPVSGTVEHLTFMPLIKGERIASVARIIFINKEKVLGNVQQTLFELSYKALPADLIEKVEVDLKEAQIGDTVRIEELEIAKDEAIEILNPPDTLVYSVTEIKRVTEETTDESEVAGTPESTQEDSNDSV
ncbi:MAG: 50S ribosomal protein L25 [Desulfotomaculaceae bacterium]|nr:50S ribosomal protein L25 [Desulfotomaculaceae bacterium]